MRSRGGSGRWPGCWCTGSRHQFASGGACRAPGPNPVCSSPVSFRRILLADDDRALAVLVSTALREEGFEVEHVSTGLQAVQSFERAPHDAVILDVLMPE